MLVTKDAYEYPVIICDSVGDMSRLTGDSPSVIDRIAKSTSKKQKIKYPRVYECTCVNYIVDEDW